MGGTQSVPGRAKRASRQGDEVPLRGGAYPQGWDIHSVKIQFRLSSKFRARKSAEIQQVMRQRPTKRADIPYQAGGSSPTKRADVSYQTGVFFRPRPKPTDVSYQRGVFARWAALAAILHRFSCRGAPKEGLEVGDVSYQTGVWSGSEALAGALRVTSPTKRASVLRGVPRRNDVSYQTGVTRRCVALTADLQGFRRCQGHDRGAEGAPVSYQTGV